MQRLIAMGVFAVLAGCSSTASYDAGKTASGEALLLRRNVVIKRCGRDGDSTSALGTVKNASSQRSDFELDFIVVSKTGVNLGSDIEYVNNVEPNQVATWSATYIADWKAGNTCKLVSIMRSASA